MESREISSSDIAAIFNAQMPRLLLPVDISRQLEQTCERFLDTLDAPSLKRRRTELRPAVNEVLENVLREKFEPPLSAYLREIPREVLCFYIERVRTGERSLRLSSHVASAPIPRPSTWNEYWLQFLLKL